MAVAIVMTTLMSCSSDDDSTQPAPDRNLGQFKLK